MNKNSTISSAMNWIETNLGFRLLGCAMFCLVLVLVITRIQIVWDIEYQWGKVLNVMQIPGKDLNERLVFIDLDGKIIRSLVGDRLLITQPGTDICIAKQKIILRRWTRYGVEYPSFCRGLKPIPTPPPDQGMQLICTKAAPYGQD